MRRDAETAEKVVANYQGGITLLYSGLCFLSDPPPPHDSKRGFSYFPHPRIRGTHAAGGVGLLGAPTSGPLSPRQQTEKRRAQYLTCGALKVSTGSATPLPPTVGRKNRPAPLLDYDGVGSVSDQGALTAKRDEPYKAPITI